MIRITAHPKDRAFLLLKVPQDLNSAIGHFGPAQLAVDLRGYVMEADKLGSLRNWAKFHDIPLLDETRVPGEPTRPLECANIIDAETGEKCCAPHRASHILKFCGACGQPANPIHYGEDAPDVGAKCGGCGRVNQGGGRYCVACGAGLPEHHLRAPKIPRTKGEPVSLGAAVAELGLGHPIPKPVSEDTGKAS